MRGIGISAVLASLGAFLCARPAFAQSSPVVGVTVEQPAPSDFLRRGPGRIPLRIESTGEALRLRVLVGPEAVDLGETPQTLFVSPGAFSFLIPQRPTERYGGILRTNVTAPGTRVRVRPASPTAGVVGGIVGVVGVLTLLASAIAFPVEALQPHTSADLSTGEILALSGIGLGAVLWGGGIAIALGLGPMRIVSESPIQ